MSSNYRCLNCDKEYSSSTAMSLIFRCEECDGDILDMGKTYKDDNPVSPNHYTEMKISPLEFIEANQDVLTWCTSNVIKYVGRHQRKNGLEDLKKAQWYLNHEIERLEEESK